MSNNGNYSGRSMVAAALPASIPANPHRRYIAVVASADVTVTISGGEPFTIASGTVWAPIPACINDLAFSGAGTLITG